MKISQELSNKIANMSLLCAFLVVSIHCGFYNSDEVALVWFNQIFAQGYSRIAVPFFFVVSGYFLACHADEKSWWFREMFKRVKTLVVPFLIWSFLYIVLSSLLAVFSNVIAGRAIFENCMIINVDWSRALGIAMDRRPVLEPLWFLRALFLYVVISWLIVKILRSIGILWIAFLYCVSIFLYYMLPNDMVSGSVAFFANEFKISGLMYFSFGMYARLKQLHIRAKNLALVAIIIGVLLLALKVYIALADCNVNLPLLLLAVPLLLFGTWWYMPEWNLSLWLTGVTFPIYLMHVIVLVYLGSIERSVHISETIYKIASWPLAFIVSLFIAVIIRRISRRGFAILFGGR